MFETYLFSDEWNQEEKDNLIKKSVYYMERTDLPEQIIKPYALVYGEDGSCIGFTYRKPYCEVISMKELFQPDNLKYYQVNQDMLFNMAWNVWKLTEELSAIGIYPGLMDLSYLCVPTGQPDKTVFLFHPEMFQAEMIPSSYPWYPSDAKLFEEEFELFDKEKQSIADGKLVYKILTAVSKGNAKIPPNQKTQDSSWQYWCLLSKEWRDYFIRLGEGRTGLHELKNLFCHKEQEEIGQEEGKGKEKAYALITVLRQAEKSVHDISRELYLLQEKLELHPTLDFAQGFVLGNKHPFTKEFRHYPKEFRSQLGHRIWDYSFGEAIMIAAEMMETALKKEYRPSIIFFLLDGEIKNDKIFQIALKRLVMLEENWYTKLVLVPVDDFKGEGYHLLNEICMKGNK